MSETIHKDALPRLANGIYHCAGIIANTIGPKGTNVLIQRTLSPGHELTNDGATIIKAMNLSDPIENMGLNFLKEAVDRSNTLCGDGSSTTTILLSEILKEGIKAISEHKIAPIDLKRELDAALPIIEKSIHEQTKQITVQDIPAVAEIAGENKPLAKTLGDIYTTIGADGIIHLEGSGTYDTSYSLINGVRFIDTGYLSPYMATDGRKAQYEKPAILVTKNKISHIKDIDPILQVLIARNEKTLVIFTDDMDSNVARALIELQKNEKRSINILIIKAPTLWKGYVFEDFAKITGATIIEDASGTSLGNKFRLDWLGTCDTIICDKEETTVIGIKDISEHIKELEEDGSTDAKLRLSWLTTKTAILKLGAKSETELSYLRLKAEDSIFSSRSALKYGIVAGGGVCLLNAAKTLPDTIGGNILKVALQSPFNQIVMNAGETGNSLLEKYGGFPSNTGSIGFNAKTNEIVDVFEAGIVDSSAIVLGAIRNSLGIAATLLTTSSVITIPPPTTQELLNQSVMKPAFL